MRSSESHWSESETGSDDLLDSSLSSSVVSKSEKSPKPRGRPDYNNLRTVGSVVGGKVAAIDQLFHVETLLGSGASGVVRKATRRSDGLTVALKTISKQGLEKESKRRLALVREVQLLQRVQREGRAGAVVRLFEVLESSDYVTLCMEYCAGGMLFTQIAEQEVTLPEELIRLIVKQIVVTVELLHSLDIVHRDLKLENILLAEPAITPQNLRIADFGVARTSDGGQLNTFVGSPGYIAPEIYAAMRRPDLGYTLRADIWSIGVCAYALLCGTLPFPVHSVLESSMELRFPKTAWSGVSKEAKKFIQCCLQKDPSSRPSATELLSKTWMRRSPSHPAPHLHTRLNLLKAGGWPTYPQ